MDWAGYGQTKSRRKAINKLLEIMYDMIEKQMDKDRETIRDRGPGEFLEDEMTAEKMEGGK